MCYLTFPFYAEGSGSAYVDKLVDEIIHVKPFKEAVQVAQDFKKLHVEP